MRVRHIEIFETICRTGSLTKAAAVLHISQPAASKLLASAERQLGFPLFDRVQGRLIATQEAKALAPQVSKLYQDLTAIRRLANNLRSGQHTHMKIGASPALGLGLLPSVVRQTLDEAPHVAIELKTYHSAELIEGLLTRALDLIITFDTSDLPGVSRTEIGQTELVHVGPPGRKGACALCELKDKPFIALDARDPSGALLQHALDSKGVTPKAVVQVQTHAMAVALAEAGCGNAVVDLITARALLRPGLMISRLNPKIVVPLNVMRQDAMPASIFQREFIERLSAHARRLAWPSGEVNSLMQP